MYQQSKVLLIFGCWAARETHVVSNIVRPMFAKDHLFLPVLLLCSSSLLITLCPNCPSHSQPQFLSTSVRLLRKQQRILVKEKLCALKAFVTFSFKASSKAFAMYNSILQSILFIYPLCVHIMSIDFKHHSSQMHKTNIELKSFKKQMRWIQLDKQQT